MLLRASSAIILLLCAFPSFVAAAQLSIDVPEEKYGPGDTFLARVRIDNEGECVNAARVILTYPKDTLKAVDFSRGNSILTLWVEGPQLNSELGTVIFSGGIPGGYCGRIAGDPALTNTLGTVIFTVTGSDTKSAEIAFAPESEVLLNDGLGTKATLETHTKSIGIASMSLHPENPWLVAVGEDTLPPDSFDITVASTRDVFNGRYYIVFSTVDKQSGLDHYEIYERGTWKTVSSPYELKDQTLRNIRVKAIDKAGNERVGTYIEGSAPPRARPAYGAMSVLSLCGLLIVIVFLKLWFDRRRKPSRDS